MDRLGSAGPRVTRLAAIALAVGLLAGCEEGGGPTFLKPKDAEAETGQSTAGPDQSRDVEAPELFQVTEAGLWDGRPSLGGVWVAHPDVTDPQRVLVRNMTNDQTVVGALFRRERDIPGPRIQVSSDAAVDLGMLAGAPVEISIIALRRVEPVEPAPQAEAPEPKEDSAIAAAAPVEVAEIPEPAVDAAAAAAPAAAPVVAVAKVSPLSKPFVQAGVFGTEENATLAVGQLALAGLSPTILEQSPNGNPFWRVVLGPAQTRSERASLLKETRRAGFPEAYLVAN